ncbi:ABC transporter permease [Pseudonocardia sp. TRM90224]|uniref:ABC transporter permease n=1 Tax=Pseudonocardia sp. TRM90224 TaxID=2812678 RepID=UPI001E55A41A|nr:ABC transporter permease [Pseudonocardia sp. TRM90224]
MTATTIAPNPSVASINNPLAGVSQSMTLAWRALVRIKHDPSELIGMSIQPTIFTVMFALVFGGAIDGDIATYVQFLIPGILVGTMLFTSMGVGHGINADLKKGVYDRLQSLPIARWAPLAGRVFADQAKQLWAIVIAVVVGLVMGFRFVNGIGGMLAATALILVFAAAFAWIAILLGILSKEPEQLDVFGFTVLLPLSFASGVYSPTDAMPGWLQWFADYNPAGMLLNACRGLITGGPVAGAVIGTLIWSVAIVAVFAPLSVRALRRRT